MMHEVCIVSGHSNIEEGGGVETCLRLQRKGFELKGIAASFVLGKTKIYKIIVGLFMLLSRHVWRPFDVIAARAQIVGLYRNVKRQLKKRQSGPILFHCHDIYAVLACKRFCDIDGVDAKIVYTVHALFYEQVLINNPSTALTLVARKMEDKALQCCSHIICVSDERRALLEKRMQGAGSMSVIPNSVNKAALVAGQAGLGEQRRVSGRYLLVPRHLYRVCGIHVAIAAMALLKQRSPDCPDFRLVIAGDGDQMQSLKQLIQELDLENDVLLLGRVPHNVLLQLITGADAVVLPSINDNGYVDGCPMSMFEAMALGRPLIASKIGGLADVLAGTDAALLVAPGSEHALCDAFISMLADAGLRSNLVANAERLLESRYSFEAWIAQQLDVYHRCLDRQQVRA